jgi:4-cresol dehydrogenase (hydroxylating)
MPQSVVQEMITKLKLGQWNMPLRFYGYDEINEANARIVKAAFAKHTKQEFEVSKWHRGEPLEKSGAGIPSLNALQAANWRGGRGGHIGFSPICASSGREATRQYELTRKRYEEYGFDYFGSFTVRERSMIHVTLLIYDRENADMTRSARDLIARLIEDGKQEGFGEYRAHVSYMDQIARSYDFNDHALLHLNEILKDALDPNGILAPGKSGIWPKALRESSNERASG